jgi:deoxyhypusine synthase
MKSITKRRQQILRVPTEPIEVNEKSVAELTESMTLTGFQGRRLAVAAQIWRKMIQADRITIFFGLSGAMVPAGMGRIIAWLIDRRYIDVLVSTGANLYHDCHEALGRKHYVGSHIADDSKLYKLKIDRIYDVFASETALCGTDSWIEARAVELLADNYPYTSREVLEIYGKRLARVRKARRRSILVAAARAGVPIFCPALADSCFGFSIMFANRRTAQRKSIIIDQLRDVDQISKITEKAGTTGVIYIGGGVPKNYIQQTAPIASYQTRRPRAHKFAIQITTDSPQWGGLSGCSFEEAVSWGKIVSGGRMAICYCDATIALPILVHALAESGVRRKTIPVFDWSDGLKLIYKPF